MTFHHFLTHYNPLLESADGLYPNDDELDFLALGYGNSSVDVAAEIVRFTSFISPGTEVIISNQDAWIQFYSAQNTSHVGFNISVERKGIDMGKIQINAFHYVIKYYFPYC